MTFESVSAEATRDGVVIRWITVMEVDTIGFRVLREMQGRPREKALDVLAEMIPSAGHGLTGATYEFRDDSKQSESAQAYYIEDTDIFSKVTRHGPIHVQGKTRVRDADGFCIKRGASR